jgi:hypothetical protein
MKRSGERDSGVSAETSRDASAGANSDVSAETSSPVSAETGEGGSSETGFGASVASGVGPSGSGVGRVPGMASVMRDWMEEHGVPARRYRESRQSRPPWRGWRGVASITARATCLYPAKTRRKIVYLSARRRMESQLRQKGKVIPFHTQLGYSLPFDPKEPCHPDLALHPGGRDLSHWPKMRP